MQKYYRFLYAALLFVPAALVFFTVSSWSAAAVGLLDPAQALKTMKNTQQREDAAVSKSDPFADFVFSDEQPATSQQTETQIGEGQNEYNGAYPVTEMFFSSQESTIVLKKDSCYVKNMTSLSAQTVRDLMLSPLGFTVEKNSAQPQILIMHTHATESYQPEGALSYDPQYSCRNTDTTQNMVAVGKVMCETLNNLGYNTIQDATLHDYPSYNGSYAASRQTVESYLEKYPSIKIVLDVHRDAIERDGERIAPTVSINGTKYAQIMIISGADNGYLNMPNYKENLKFASAVQNYTSKMYPGLTRPILFDYRNYNQQLTTGSILVEIGSHASTLSSAKNSAYAFASGLAAALDKI